eukprot:TRINITY_DN149_c0_g2_i1.p1 TRINITY_DN149_c0_g2~~TRINITY_DN149_c0_g2_i1.p1  ORF type:complete len:1674 (+),score=225.85 TRINITY_DN149_c0_g2_i1:72-5093(+)
MSRMKMRSLFLDTKLSTYIIGIIFFSLLFRAALGASNEAPTESVSAISIFVALNGTGNANSCGTSFINPCLLASVPSRLEILSKDRVESPVDVVVAPAVYELDFSLFLRYQFNLSFISASASDPVIIRADKNIQFVILSRSARVENVHFSGFTSRAFSTSVDCQSLLLRGCHFRNNTVVGHGGAAVHFEGSFLTIDNCVFEDNIADAKVETDVVQGGAVSFLFSITQNAQIQITNSRFQDNMVRTPIPVKVLSGGAVHVSPKIDLTIPNVTSVHIFIENTIFEGNVVNLNDYAYLPGSHSAGDLLAGAVSVDTAVIFSAALSMNIQNSTFQNNRIEADMTRSKYSSGGAIYVTASGSGSSMTINNTKFTANIARVGNEAVSDSFVSVCEGGAITINSPLSLNISNSLFFYNRCFSAGSPSVLNRAFGGAVSYRILPLSDHGRKRPPSITIESSAFEYNSIQMENGTSPLGSHVLGGAIAFDFGLNPTLGAVIVKDSRFIGNLIDQLNADVAGAGLSFGGAKVSLKRLAFLNTTFESNHFKVLPILTERLHKNTVTGGAISITLLVAHQFDLDFIGCRFVSNFATSGATYGISNGGAIALTIALDAQSNSGIPVLVRDCFFSRNYAQSLPSAGGAMHISGRIVPLIESSTFEENFARCFGSEDPEDKYCNGGAIDMFLPGNATIRNCTFLGNYVVGTTATCTRATGGAVAIFGGKSTMENTIFYNNTLEVDVSIGGAVHISSGYLNATNCLFIGNSARGFSTSGGALATKGSETWLTNVSFIQNASSREKAQLTDSKCGNYNGGGAISVERYSFFAATDVNITDSEADYGGALYLEPGSGVFRGTVVSNIFVSNSYAAMAGGALYFANACGQNNSHAIQVCANIREHTMNVSSGAFGPICAGEAKELMVSGPSDIFVSPGQKASKQFRLIDAFHNVVNTKTEKIFAVVASKTGNIKVRLGAPKDTMFANDDGVVVFDDILVEGSVGSSASIVFIPSAGTLCKRALRPLTANVTVTVAHCLPGYFSTVKGSKMICEVCPAHTYTIHSNQSVCEPCSSHPIESLEQEYSCLQPPEIFGQEGDEFEKSRHHDLNSFWRISEGFYPLPLLEDPEELEVCPNDACLSFVCNPLVQEDFTWKLDCSSCPVFRHNGTEPNPVDCHCKLGFEDRLCSKCSCNATNGICFFASGEAEDRNCIRCKSQSTLILVAAVVALQGSLVVFLLFRRSSLALLLAEAAIAITLLMSGIGESWMLDLVIVMGLLFLITSLSQRKHKPPHPVSIDLEDEADQPNHHTHLAAAETAALAKITIFFVQSAAAVIRDSTWPEWIEAAMKRLEAINLRVSGVECFAPSLLANPVGKLLFHMSLPWILAVNIGVAAVISALLIRLDPVWRIKNFCSRIQKRKRRGVEAPPPSDDEHQGLLYTEALPSDEDVQQQRRKPWSAGDLWSRVQFSVLFLLSASYFELSNGILEILKPCSKGYMANFQWIPCSLSDSTYGALFISAIVFFILYTVGIPAFFGAIMFRNRRRILAGDPNLEAKYGFLYESYRHKVFWFELIWFLRRILLSVAVSTFTSSSSYQLGLIFVLLQGSLILHRYVKPFYSNLANTMDLTATAVLLFGAVMGYSMGEMQRVTTTSAVVLQNLVWTSCALVAFALLFALITPVLRMILQKCKRKQRFE